MTVSFSPLVIGLGADTTGPRSLLPTCNWAVGRHDRASSDCQLPPHHLGYKFAPPNSASTVRSFDITGRNACNVPRRDYPSIEGLREHISSATRPEHGPSSKDSSLASPPSTGRNPFSRPLPAMCSSTATPPLSLRR